MQQLTIVQSGTTISALVTPFVAWARSMGTMVSYFLPAIVMTFRARYENCCLFAFVVIRNVFGFRVDDLGLRLRVRIKALGLGLGLGLVLGLGLGLGCGSQGYGYG